MWGELFFSWLLSVAGSQNPAGSPRTRVNCFRSWRSQHREILWTCTITLPLRAEVCRFFEGLDLVEPGVLRLHRWRPDTGDQETGRELANYGGVALSLCLTPHNGELRPPGDPGGRSRNQFSSPSRNNGRFCGNCSKASSSYRSTARGLPRTFRDSSSIRLGKRCKSGSDARLCSRSES
jgi:hypothetical protein